MAELVAQPGFPLLPPGISELTARQIVLSNANWRANGGGITVNKVKTQTLDQWEETDGYTEEWRRDDGEQMVKRYFLVPWSNRKAFIEDMLGYSNNLPGVGGNPVLSRTIPHQVPEPGFEHLYASSVRLIKANGQWRTNPNLFLRNAAGEIEFEFGPIGANGQALATPIRVPMICYVDGANGTDGICVYEVTFRAYPYTILSDNELNARPAGQRTELERYVERQKKPAVQALPLPRSALVFTDANGGDVTDAAAFKIVHTAELVYTWHEVPDDPVEFLQSYTSTVNDGDFDGARGWPTYAAGTLLMMAPSSIPYRTVTGRMAFRVTFNFLYREIGHNNMYDRTGAVRPVGYRDTLAPLYTPRDWSVLFKVPDARTYQ